MFSLAHFFQNAIFVSVTITSIASRLDLWTSYNEVPSSKPVGHVFVLKPFVISFHLKVLINTTELCSTL